MLDVSGFSWTNRLPDVSLSSASGEIVGLGGLDGQGQRELLLGLFGVLRETARRDQARRAGRRPAQPGRRQGRRAVAGAGARGPQERGPDAVDVGAREHDARGPRRVSRGPLIDLAEETRIATQAVRDLAIKAPSLEQPVGSLSGGNQQKVVLAKWLLTEPRMILLMDPTRGIDVGTKQEFYRLMRTLADAGRQHPVLQHRL